MRQRNAFIVCEVRSQPAVCTLYWLIDRNGTTLVAGQVIREYWTLVLVSLYYVLLSHLVSLFTGSIARSANLPVFSLLRGQF